MGNVNLYRFDPDFESLVGVKSYSNLAKSLTSIHCNATDTFISATGEETSLNIYDINTGLIVRTLPNAHNDIINIARFANHMPDIFLTCSFDCSIKLWDLRMTTPARSVTPGSAHRVAQVSNCIYSRCSNRGNIMITFSPDDRSILSCALDNEVKQYSTRDGRLELQMDIPTVGSSVNYTRAYYANDGEVVVSGSACSDVAYINCARTGELLESVCLRDGRREPDLYIQSLRGNPLKCHRFAVLVFYKSGTAGEGEGDEPKPYELLDVDLTRNSAGELVHVSDILGDSLRLGLDLAAFSASGMVAAASAPLTQLATVARSQPSAPVAAAESEPFKKSLNSSDEDEERLLWPKGSAALSPLLTRGARQARARTDGLGRCGGVRDDATWEGKGRATNFLNSQLPCDMYLWGRDSNEPFRAHAFVLDARWRWLRVRGRGHSPGRERSHRSDSSSHLPDPVVTLSPHPGVSLGVSLGVI